MEDWGASTRGKEEKGVGPKMPVVTEPSDSQPLPEFSYKNVIIMGEEE